MKKILKALYTINKETKKVRNELNSYYGVRYYWEAMDEFVVSKKEQKLENLYHLKNIIIEKIKNKADKIEKHRLGDKLLADCVYFQDYSFHFNLEENYKAYNEKYDKYLSNFKSSSNINKPVYSLYYAVYLLKKLV